MKRRRKLIRGVFDRLFSALGPQYWWPADTPFEVIVGAILTQNTAWRNVKQAIGRLRESNLLTGEAINAVSLQDLASLIRSSGYYNQKARKLKAFCEHVQNHWQGRLNDFLSQDMENLRAELLGLHGIGPETADSIILYAAGQPSFVVDAYTHRIFHRHGWVPEAVQYEDLRSYFMEALEPDPAMYQEYHALLVRTGHLYCRRKPTCGSCPLHEWEQD
ncbi:MAG TPA: endonuclease III domain-containing protein [Syntrophobacteraceae bacterium]|nr:endonuclease III domain-containing protein [Syntrophobacteraceae bacterium]